jgi:predicted RNA binding protein YcfA (HicA-like mRNA interferase family)
VPSLGAYNKRARVIRALERAGFNRAQGAKHLVMHHADGRYTTIPNSRVIAVGTLRAIIRQCGLTTKEFIRLYQR